ncbi:LacI family DNA-binding transcriptional regulator [Mycoplasmopsis hyopharyngis]|uniref:LacI family DNA-binding transcriptional regulator n=1 Tax=Mycoplasmopsis hyopharyngis TaxID=29558 RepID=UPI003872ADBB
MNTSENNVDKLDKPLKTKKAVTYKDIVSRTGASIGTVSRYFNGGYVSKTKKALIEQVVKDLNYYPNHGARLIRGRDTTIFVIVPEWFENSFTQIMNGIDSDARKKSLKVVTTYSTNDPNNYIDTIKYVQSWKPNSIVLFLPKNYYLVEEYLKNNPMEIPTIIYGHQIEGYSSITIDLEKSFYDLTKEFIPFVEEKQKILMILDTKLDSDSMNIRKKGFLKACLEHNMDYEIYTLNSKNSLECNYLFKKITNEKITNIVCSTHDTYINLASSGMKNLRLTDIGFASVYDRTHRYKAKIFIDYALIGFYVHRMIQTYQKEKITENKVVKPEIIVNN